MLDHEEKICSREALGVFRMHFLMEGSSTLFFRAGCIEERGTVHLSFRTAGYGKLSGMGLLPASRLLGCMTQLIRKIRDTERYYIFPSDFSLQTDLIYVGVMKDVKQDVRMIFLPEGPGEDQPVRQRLAALLGEWCALCEPAGRGYLEKAQSVILKGKSGLRIMLHRLDLLQEEARQCGC